MKKKFLTLALAGTILSHGVFANVDSIRNYIQAQVSKTLSVKPEWGKRSDTLYLGERKKTHEEIIGMNFDNIISLYGLENGLDIIKEHMIVEINKARATLWLNPLVEDIALSNVAQSQADFVAKNPQLYDRSWRNSAKNPHYSYDENNNTLMPRDRAEQAGIWFSEMYENANKGIRTISWVLQARNDSPEHKGNMYSHTGKRGIGLDTRTGILFAMFME